MTEKEVSELTGIALSTLRNARAAKHGISYHKIGRSVRYSYSDVTEFMRQRRIRTEDTRG